MVLSILELRRTLWLHPIVVRESCEEEKMAQQGAFAVIIQFALVIGVMGVGMAFVWGAAFGGGGPETAGRFVRWVGRMLLRALAGLLRLLAQLLNALADWISP